VILREAILRYGPGRRVAGPNRIRDAEDAVQICQDLRDEVQEHFCVMLLNSKGQVLGRYTAAVGSLTEVAIHPREVFRAAIQAGAASVVLVHNHPSGDSTPSSQDDLITDKLRKIGKLIGIPVLDHVVMGVEDHYSYQEQVEWSDPLEEV
jgi:DNA repair protein RadC